MIKPKTHLLTRLLLAAVAVMIITAPWIVIIGIIGYLVSLLVKP